MQSVLITGANRGLGLEYAKAFVDANWKVLACCRDPERATNLQALRKAAGASVSLHALDVADHEAVDALATSLSKESLDLLLNNAGTFGPLPAMEGAKYQSLDNMDYDIWRQMLEVNVLGVFKVATAFLSHLERDGGGAVVNMSSDLGSIGNNTMGSSHAYRATKTAVNMLTAGMAVELRDRKVTVISMAPGWCKTDLGGSQAPLDPTESVADQMPWLTSLSPEHSGRFLDRFGNDVAW